MKKEGKPARYLRIFRRCFRVALSNSLAYRADFVLSALTVFFSNALFPIVAILIYGSGSGFPGWTFYQVLLIQSLFTLSAGISRTFFRGIFWQTNFSIREGTFEVSLLKPLDTLFWLAASSIQLENLGMVAGGIVMAAIALAKCGGASLAGVLAAIPLFLGGVCVMLGIDLLLAGTAFRWVGNSRMPDISDSVLGFAKYPQGVFPQAARVATTFILPCSMIGFFPAIALLGKTQPWHFLALIPCALFMAAGIFFYKAMIRYYEGVGG
jgi:ABC-2 type transport system permease protein